MNSTFRGFLRRGATLSFALAILWPSKSSASACAQVYNPPLAPISTVGGECGMQFEMHTNPGMGIRRAPVTGFTWAVQPHALGPIAHVYVSDANVVLSFKRAIYGWKEYSACVPDDDARLEPNSDAFYRAAYKVEWTLFSSLQLLFPDLDPNGAAYTAWWECEDEDECPPNEFHADCHPGEMHIWLLYDPTHHNAQGQPDAYFWWGTPDGKPSCTPNCDTGPYLDLDGCLLHEYGHGLGFNHLPDTNSDGTVNHTFDGTFVMTAHPLYTGHVTAIRSCEIRYEREIYPDDVHQCDRHPDAFVDNYFIRSAGGGSTDVSWTCAYEHGTDHFALYSGPAAGGPWSLTATVPPDTSHEYHVSTASSGPFFRLLEIETAGDTLHCATDSLMTFVPAGPVATPGQIDSIATESKVAGTVLAATDPTPGPPPVDWTMAYVCIGPANWWTPVRPLIDHWNTHGLKAGFKSVESIAAGGFTIKSYLQSLHDHLPESNLRYVLLLGDADQNGEPGKNIISTNYHYNPEIGVWSLQFASDWDYVDFNNNRTPEIAIGRAPVRSEAEVTLFVNKTIRAALTGSTGVPVDHMGLFEFAYDDGTKPGMRVRINAGILSMAVPPRVVMDELVDSPSQPMTDVTRRVLATAAMEEGRAMITVQGTGTNYNNWQFLNAATFNWSMSAPNWRLHPFIVGMTCDIGDFDLPEGIAEHWPGRPLLELGLLEPGRGPWGAFAPSRAAGMDGSRRIAKVFVQAALGGPGLGARVGESALQAVNALASDPNYGDMAWSYVLVGDPAVRLSNGVVGAGPIVNIAGPTEVTPGVYETWTASASAGDGIYTYAWYKRALTESEWTPCGTGATCINTVDSRNMQLRCIVLSAGMAGEATACVGSTAQPVTTTVAVQGLSIVSPGESLVDVGDQPYFTAVASDRTCRTRAYDWRTRPAGTTNWSSIVSTSASYQWPAPLVNAVDLLATATTEGVQVSQVVEVRFRSGGGGGGGGCPTVDVLDAGGWTTENTVLGRSLAGSLMLDDYRLKSAPAVVDEKVRLRIRENEQEYTRLDQVRLIAVDHSVNSRAYGVGEKVLLGVPVPAARISKSSGEDITAQINGGTGYMGQPGDTLFVDQTSWGTSTVGSASVVAGVPSIHGGDDDGGPPIIDDGGGKGSQPIAGNLRGPKPGTTVNPDAQVLSNSGILVQAQDNQGEWQTITHYYPRESPDGAVLDTTAYDRLRLVFVGQHSISFLGHLERATESLVATKLPLVAALHSRHGDVSGAVSTLGNVTTDLAPGDTVNLTFHDVALEPGKIRDLFLLSNGVYTSNLPAGSHPADPPVPVRYALYGNRPNPFSAATTIRFDLPKAGNVRLEIFDLQGRLIKTLANQPYEAGAFSITWAHTSDTGQPVRPGIYLYRMIASGFRAQEKMLLLP